MLKDRAVAAATYSIDLTRLLTALRGQLKSFAALALALWMTKSFVLESFYIPSESMVPTLESDDFILVPKFAYGIRIPFMDKSIMSWSTPQRGQVVVFRRPDDPSTAVDEGTRAMVKRVIGIPGDRISIHGSTVEVNGAVVDEQYARWTKGGIDQEQAFDVPGGSLFVLGDNRDESFDSRFWQQPFVSSDRVVGPVAAIYWSSTNPDRSGTLIR